MNVSVVSTISQPPSNTAFLSGQTLISLNASGVADIEDLVLRALPGSYYLVVALPDYPQVTWLATLLLRCAAVDVCFVILHLMQRMAIPHLQSAFAG